jgi:hypothetical protein
MINLRHTLRAAGCNAQNRPEIGSAFFQPKATKRRYCVSIEDQTHHDCATLITLMPPTNIHVKKRMDKDGQISVGF